MKIIRVFPSGLKKRGNSMIPRDGYSFIGDPPDELTRPKADEVHISCTFTWDRLEAERLKNAWQQYYPVVKLGGPAYGQRDHKNFVPGKYIIPGVTFTSTGCNSCCPWCLVGDFKELPIIPGHIIQDDNILQCSRKHIEQTFEMLRYQGKPITFSGGIDSRLITEWFIDELRTVKINQLFLACDTEQALKPLREAIKRIGLKRDKLRCYTLLAFDGESIDDAAGRLKEVYEAGALPFAQLYQPPEKYIKYSWNWRELARKWSRPAIMKTIMKVK